MHDQRLSVPFQRIHMNWPSIGAVSMLDLGRLIKPAEA